MIPIPHSLSPVLPGVPAPVLLLALLGVSLFLIFAGRTLAKVVAFLAVGIIGAAFGGSIAVQYLAPQWQILGLLLGFVIGGLLGVVLLPLGVGLAVGYAGYVVALELALGPTAAIIAGVALFVVGALLSSKILSVATALIGGLLLFDVLTHYGFGSTLATLVATFLTLAGLWVQLELGRHPSEPTTTSVGGQPSARD
jgi:hypothetical protein